MTKHAPLDAGAAVVAILDIGGLDRPFVRRGTSGVLEERSSESTALVRFEDIGSVDVDDAEIAPTDATPGTARLHPTASAA